MGHTRTRRNNQQKRYDMGSAGMVGYKGLIAGLSPDYVAGDYDEQIGGDFDMMGDDLAGDELGNDELGARRAMARHGKPSARGGMRDAANRRYDLGLGSVSVPAGGTAVLTGAPAIRFRVDRLMLVASAVGVLVRDIKSGIVSQTVGGAGSPVESFDPRAIGAQMSGQTLDPAIPVVVTLENTTGAAITVSGNIFGLADQ